MIKQQRKDAGEVVLVLSELRAIKRLLALLLLQQGVGQQQVAKAAGVAKLTINQLANAGSGARKSRGRKLGED